MEKNLEIATGQRTLFNGSSNLHKGSFYHEDGHLVVEDKVIGSATSGQLTPLHVGRLGLARQHDPHTSGRCAPHERRNPVPERDLGGEAVEFESTVRLAPGDPEQFLGGDRLH